MFETTFFSLPVIYLCVLQGAVLTEIRTSRACYGSPGLPCTEHTISCSRTQKIAIVDAYFTHNRECGAGLSNCDNVSPDNLTALTFIDNFNNTQLISLYHSCSTQNQCEHQAPRYDAAGTFSIVKYVCVEGGSVIPFSEETRRNESETTIVYKHADSRKNPSYTCTIQSEMPVNITSLDIRLGDGHEPKNCSTLTIDRTVYTCSDVIEPNKLLKTIQSPGQSHISLQVKEGTRLLVWLRITSRRNFVVSCSATRLSVRVRIKTAGRVTVATRTESTSTKVSVTAPVVSSTESPETTDPSSKRTGLVVAAVFGTLLFVAVVSVFLWCWRKRKVDKKPIPKLPRRTTLDGQRKTAHAAVNSPQQTSYDEIDDLRQHLASNYNYVTSDRVTDSNAYFILETKEQPVMSNNGSNPEDEYNHLRQGLSPLSGTYDTTASAAKSAMNSHGSNLEDQYNHLGQGLPPLSGTYDTTASAAKSVLNSHGSKLEDEYNHLGQGLSPVPGTYDTTASAAKSVMSSLGSNTEDQYNHLGQGLPPLSGTYDTTASAAKSMEQAGSSPADTCYDHLKQNTPTEHISNVYDITEKHLNPS